MATSQRPDYESLSNYVATVRGHLIFRDEDGIRCNLFTPDTGWWGWKLEEDDARRVCETVVPYEESK